MSEQKQEIEVMKDEKEIENEILKINVRLLEHALRQSKKHIEIHENQRTSIAWHIADSALNGGARRD